MNGVVEKWVTIAALTGWIGSMGSMVVLAVSAPAVNPAIQASERFAAHNTDGLSVSTRVKLTPIQQSMLAEPRFLQYSTAQPTQLTLDPKYRHWLDQGNLRAER